MRKWNRQIIPTLKALRSSSVVKNLSAIAGDACWIPDLEDSLRFPGEEIGNPLQYACLGNLRDRRAW